jgi:hypothetical protein
MGPRGSRELRIVEPVELDVPGRDFVADTRLRPVREPLGARVVALGTLAIATTTGVVLVGAGAAPPPWLPVLALLAIVAITVNRGAFFPTELAATSEVAVLVAAIAGFHGDAAVLGPLVVALAVGPLDVLHWRQRAWVRMAYNSGSQGVAVLAGTAAFAAVVADRPPAFLTFAVASAGAGVAYALADSACGAVLMRARGDGWRGAVTHQWTVNRLAPPLAVVGGLAGFVANGSGWLPALVVLAPTPWVPELVLVPARTLRARARIAARWACIGLAAAADVALLVAVAPGRAAAPAVALTACALAAGIELDVSRARVAPLAALVVVAGATVFGGPAEVGVVAAAVTAVLVTLTAWVRRPRAPSVVVAAALAAGLAGAATGGVARMVEWGHAAGATTAAGVGCVLVFVAVAVAVGDLGASRAAAVVWAFPLLVVGALLAAVWARTGLPGAAMYAVGVGGVLALVVWVAPPPWDSSGLARVLAHRRAPDARIVTAALVALGATAGAVAVSQSGPGAGTVPALVAGAACEAGLAVALAAARQWRFTPNARRATAGAGVALAALIPAVYLPLAWSGWSAAAGVLVLVGTGALAISWPAARAARSGIEVRR